MSPISSYYIIRPSHLSIMVVFYARQLEKHKNGVIRCFPVTPGVVSKLNYSCQQWFLAAGKFKKPNETTRKLTLKNHDFRDFADVADLIMALLYRPLIIATDHDDFSCATAPKTHKWGDKSSPGDHGSCFQPKLQLLVVGITCGEI